MMRSKLLVPDCVGQPVHIARDTARELGLSLANIDIDGPPVGALSWPGLYYITSQNPLAGEPANEGDWIFVTIAAHDPGDSAGMILKQR
ncbi:hypothetical protein M2390_001803 [Mycetocola sp. BIGb0189]|nr:PASTA domain-containing protein [Mycetocola sp. BIGb0189]MCS4276609.1 hypothetical protein [Mycetocola sp. BIGb0189]